MPVRTNQLALLLPSTSAVTTAYTCPASTRTIVKCLTMYASSAGARDVVWGIQRSGTTYKFCKRTVAADATVEVVDLFVVLLSGDVLTVQTSSGGTCFVSASGAELAA